MATHYSTKQWINQTSVQKSLINKSLKLNHIISFFNTKENYLEVKRKYYIEAIVTGRIKIDNLAFVDWQKLDS